MKNSGKKNRTVTLTDLYTNSNQVKIQAILREKKRKQQNCEKKVHDRSFIYITIFSRTWPRTRLLVYIKLQTCLQSSERDFVWLLTSCKYGLGIWNIAKQRTGKLWKGSQGSHNHVVFLHFSEHVVFFTVLVQNWEGYIEAIHQLTCWCVLKSFLSILLLQVLMDCSKTLWAW